MGMDEYFSKRMELVVGASFRIICSLLEIGKFKNNKNAATGSSELG